MIHDKELIVSVFGSYRPVEGDANYELARRLGGALARAGCTVCNGGYAGTMEAGARGAREAGGATIGVTSDYFRTTQPNRYIDREIRTKDLAERLQTIVSLAAAYVFLKGGTGTLLELALVLENTSKGACTPRPVVFMGEFWRPVVDLVLAERPARDPRLPSRIPPKLDSLIAWAASPEEVPALIENLRASR